MFGNDVAEVEGRLVVAADATFSPTNSSLFLGTAVASWILPSPGSVFLQVGGATDVTRNSISLASEFGDQGGFAVSREYTPGSIELFIPHSDGPSARTSASPLGSFTVYKDKLSAVSSTLGALPSTHSVTEGSRFGTPTTVFRVPTLNTSPAVFSVDASVLSTAIEFDIPATQAVVINVLNTATVTVANPSLFDLSQVDHNNLSTQVDLPTVGHLAGNLLWNFPNAQSLSLTGTAQFPGSVVMGSPESTTRIGLHTNGRLFVAGDLSFEGLTAQSGLENHAYPWIGGMIFGCDAPTTPFEPTVPVEPTVPGGPVDQSEAGGSSDPHGDGGEAEPHSDDTNELAQTGASPLLSTVGIAAACLLVLGAVLKLRTRRLS